MKSCRSLRWRLRFLLLSCRACRGADFGRRGVRGCGCGGLGGPVAGPGGTDSAAGRGGVGRGPRSCGRRRRGWRVQRFVAGSWRGNRPETLRGDLESRRQEYDGSRELYEEQARAAYKGDEPGWASWRFWTALSLPREGQRGSHEFSKRGGPSLQGRQRLEEYRGDRRRSYGTRSVRSPRKRVQLQTNPS